MKYVGILKYINTIFLFLLFSCNSTQDMEREKLHDELTEITLSHSDNTNVIEEYLNNKGIEYTILDKNDYSGKYHDRLDYKDKILTATYYIKKNKNILPAIIKESQYFIRLIIDEENKIKYVIFDEIHLGI